MSEMDTTTSSATSGPDTSGAPDTGGPPDAGGGGERVSTNAISASVLEELEAADDGTGDPAAHAATASVEPKTQEPPPVAEETEADKLLKDAGYAAKKQDGRDNWIKYSSVRKIIDNQLTKGRTADQARVTSIEQERDTYKADMEEFGRDVRGDPRAFLDKLARVDSRYQAFLTAPAAPGSAPAGQDYPEPAPDLDLGNGRVSYSLDGLRKLREWDKRQYDRAIDAKLKPFTERDQQAQAQHERGRLEQAIRTRAQDQIAKAESWPLFGKYDPTNLTEFQQAVLKELDADKALSFFDAYMKVATPRLSADRSKVRDEVLKELQTAPTSTAIPKTSGGTPTAGRQTSIRDIAASTYDELANRR